MFFFSGQNVLCPSTNIICKRVCKKKVWEAEGEKRREREGEHGEEYLRQFVCVCVFVYVLEREREKERKRKGERRGYSVFLSKCCCIYHVGKAYFGGTIVHFAHIHVTC